jgi:hypothetical protein
MLREFAFPCSQGTCEINGSPEMSSKICKQLGAYLMEKGAGGVWEATLCPLDAHGIIARDASPRGEELRDKLRIRRAEPEA